MTRRFHAASAQLPARLARHLSSLWGEPVELGEFTRFPAGMSWITMAVRATVGGTTRELILRVGDPQGLFGPYSSKPEFEALTALASGSGVPIPRTWAASDDESILGAPFLVTQRMPGDTPTPWKGVAEMSQAHRESLAGDFADALAALHTFEWNRTSLAAWAAGRDATNAARRELDHWVAYAGQPLPPMLHYAMRWLQANAPAADRLVLVHGDYRVGNFLQQQGRITSILDWELVHLGDAHEDLAWAGLRAFAPAGSKLLGGLVDPKDFHARYTERSGLAVDARKLAYYRVFALFKSAAMLLGASRRVDEGRSSDIRMAAMGFQLAPTMMELDRLLHEAQR
jgi:aminoglycoside phosphotransferase (APT) family kinase protein